VCCEKQSEVEEEAGLQGCSTNKDNSGFGFWSERLFLIGIYFLSEKGPVPWKGLKIVVVEELSLRAKYALGHINSSVSCMSRSFLFAHLDHYTRLRGDCT
jgi:hypothetical protein